MPPAELASRRLFLVDGYALIYRAFFALISRPLRTSRGENTSAAWGVANFLLRLRAQYQPDYLAWVNDAGDSGRTRRFPAYKSTRQKLDEAMQADFDLALEQVRDLLAAFRVEVVEVPGYEADDVIGTLAAAAAGQGIQAVIVSGDKDLYQLIGPRVALLNPGRGGPAGVEEQWVDQSNAAERLGVPPSQVVDYLALVGDSSDNIPGVRGIGPKGACQLLSRYGDLDTILARADEIQAKRTREGLQAHAADARLSRELVTIQRDVPVALELDRLAGRDADPQALRAVLSRLEFHSLANRLAPRETAPPSPPPPPSSPSSPRPLVSSSPHPLVSSSPRPLVSSSPVRVVTDPTTLRAMVDALRGADWLAIRPWGAGPDARDWSLVGLALAGDPGRTWYLPFRHEAGDGLLAAGEASPPQFAGLSDPALEEVAGLLGDPARPKLAHDLKAAWEALRGDGVELAGPGEDVMLASFVLDPGRRSYELDTLCLDHLGHGLGSPAEVIGRSPGPAAVPPEAAARQCALELEAIAALHQRFTPTLRETGLDRLYREMELPLVPVLVDMEWTGIAINPALFRALGASLEEELRGLERRIAEAAGTAFNVNSPRQLAAVLFEKLQLPVLRKTKTGPSTDAAVLEQLAAQGHEVPRLLLEHRELQKLRSTYVDVLPTRVNRRTGRIHTRFNQTGAATGRLSSSEPNLQNIPVRTARGEAIRRGFVPTAGWRFVVADYSQIELRLLAHCSEDPAFLEAFARGEDVHRQTAALVFGVAPGEVTPELRARAKTINFATIYGQGAFALSQRLSLPLDEARSFIARYFERFAGVRAWLDRQVELARARGWVETLFGRRRYVPEIKDKNFNVRSFGERLAQNSPLQGSAADLIKLAMIRVHQALAREGLAARLLLQVHDELVLEAPPAEVERVGALVRTHMEGAARLRVPLVVEVGVGETWLDAKA